ncbi:hypothetical protein [Ideonella livida]|uniref:Roadblock/LAMTOR2 domain-containing protein n=1 Tax=Ideonella livida TaxID=2707176 RepID=A0A7C9TL12_9BURK|nr:hypothetical protein [Ideonella livida]NDY92898.1 hypothetical protein [Ideonella livida]
MKAQVLAQVLQDMVGEAPGVLGCALVEAGSGLLWQRAGQDFGPHLVWEAAVDYWRLQERLHGHFEPLGPLGAATLHHRLGVVVVLPCVPEHPLLLVAVGRHREVDWAAWQHLNLRLAALLRQAMAPAA